MRKSDLSLFLLALVLASAPSLGGEWPRSSVAANHPGVVNINTANASQLILLPRVGEEGRASGSTSTAPSTAPFRRSRPGPDRGGRASAPRPFELVAPYVSPPARPP